MIAKITRALIAQLPVSEPSSTKQVFWDAQLPCFGVYMNAARRVSFIYQYRMPGGKTKSILIGYSSEYSIEAARLVAGEYAQQRRKGFDPIAILKSAKAEEEASEELVFSAYAENYIARRIATKKPLNKAQTAIVRRDIIGHLGELRIDKMTVKDVDKFSATLGERGESARRMGIVYLKAILNDAIKRGMIKSSPAAAINTPKSGQRDRRLREREIQRFYEAIHDMGGPRGDACEVILRMLKRKEEVTQMQWEQLDLAKGRWYLPGPRTKNRNPYQIELPRQVIAIIEGQQPDLKLRRGPVFTLNGGKTSPEMGAQVKDLIDANMARRLELANARDGVAETVAHFTIHDVRTTGASSMQEAPLSVPTDVINAVLLHVVGSGVTQIYLRSGLVIEAGEALQRWNDWLDALMSSETAWPGGRDLPGIDKPTTARLLRTFRAGWPERTDQRKAREKREQEVTDGTKTLRKRKPS